MDKNSKKSLKKTTIIFYLFIIFLFWVSMILFGTANWIYKTFGEVIFEAIVFTLTSPVDGDAAVAYKWQYLSQMGIETIKALVFGGVMFALLLRRTKFTQMLSKIIVVIAFAVFAWSLYYVNNEYHIVSYFADKGDTSTMIDDNYVKVEPADAVFPENKRNLILIMLESVEDTFSDPQYFPEPLMPQLAQLREENLNFHKHYQVLATSWSAAGLTSYVFGLPLVIPVGVRVNVMQHRKDFLPGAISILEIMEAHGYQVILTKGHYASFAGWDKLFEGHAPGAQI